MSNSFPKVTPDGRWIVFVQARNGMVMRPDGKLYIVPFEGGEARLMKCNTPLMNSWHTFSPNGRWMAFSSKSRSPYTQLYLTHVDANGNDTPPILVDNTTAANRAVNLPEFANIPKGGLEKIDPAANDFYRMENTAIELMTKNQFAEAISVWRNALAKDPSDGRSHLNLAYSLGQTGQPREALEEYRQACDLTPTIRSRLPSLRSRWRRPASRRKPSRIIVNPWLWMTPTPECRPSLGAIFCRDGQDRRGNRASGEGRHSETRVGGRA